MKTLTLRQRPGNTGYRVWFPKIVNRRWWILPSFLLVGLAGYFIYRENQTVNRVLIKSNSQSSTPDIIAAEKQFPEEYVTGQVKMRRNFINEIIIEGSLRNIARFTNYRDAILRVDFLSKSGSVVFTKDYKISEVIPPNGAAKFRFKNPSSTDVDRISGSILKAELCN